RHFSGAGEIGSNYVTLPDRVYVVYGRAILELDAGTGDTLKQFTLPASSDQGPPNFGYLGVWNDLLVATADPLDVPVQAVPVPKSEVEKTHVTKATEKSKASADS